MKLLKRLKFALKYNIEPTFIVYDFKGQQVVSFQEYDDAVTFSQKHQEYLAKVLVAVEEMRKIR